MAKEGIELEVCLYNDPFTKLDTITGRTEPSQLRELSGLGGGSFKINRLNKKIVANPTLLTSRNIVRTRVNGKIVGAWMIQTRQSDTITDGEKSKEIYTIAGEGVKTWFDDAEVRPYGGLKATAKDVRSFSFASLDGNWYHAADWVTPTPVIKVGDAVGSPWRFNPTNWPDDAVNAWWVWGQQSKSGAPAGDNYYRLSFTIAADGNYSFYLAGDDYYDIYVDGELVTSADPTVQNFIEAKKVDMDLLAGTHIIGVKATNIDDGSVAGIVGALFFNTVAVPPTDLGVVTINISTDVFTLSSGSVPANNTQVQFITTGALPTGMDADSQYYIVGRSGSTFKIANKKSGPAIALTGTQSGTHRLELPAVDSVPKLITYTNLNPTLTASNLTKAQAKNDSTHDTWSALPAGNSSGTKTQKAQAKKKAAALAIYQTAQAALAFAQMEKNASDAQTANAVAWKVNGYPAVAPGWTPGDIILTLMHEAQVRGVLFPNWLTPTFTALVDSNGTAWGDPQAWDFNVGTDTLATVVAKLEELTCNVWIDVDTDAHPGTFNLNAAITRGVDRSVFTYAGDGITATSTPVTFEKGKNLLSASFTNVGKIKNSISLNTSDGWLAVPEQDAASIAKYGVIEGTLATSAGADLSKQLADIVIAQKATEEEGATYNIMPTGKVPLQDYAEGDWVLAPNETGLLVRRQIMSITTTEGTAGNPLYAMEFDTVFQDNDQRINAAIAKLGGGGVGGGYANGSGSGGTFGGPSVVTPPSNTTYKIPQAPANVTGFSIGQWAADGITQTSELTISWDPVTQNTDGSAVIPTFYDVWARLNDDDHPDFAQYARVTVPSATIPDFVPGSDWVFEVQAIDNTGRGSDFSEDFEHVMDAPLVPMDPPSAPILTTKLGLVTARWDGTIITGGAPVTPPPQFRYVFALVSTDGGTTFTRMGSAIIQANGTTLLSGLAVGSTPIVEFIAVDGVGIPSAVSATANITVAGIDLGDLDASINEAIEAAQAAADAAQTSADGKNTIHHETTPPPAPLSTDREGDVWWVDDGTGTGVIAQQWVFTSGAWLQVALGDDLIAVGIDAGKINVGTLDAEVIAAQSITGDQIAFETLTGDNVQARSIEGEQIAAETIEGVNVKAGTLTADLLRSDVGSALDISSNDSVNILVDAIADVGNQADATDGTVNTLATYYTFGPTGAIIRSPGNPYAIHIASDRIEILQAGVVVSYWNAGQLFVNQFVGTSVVLGNHSITKYTTGTVVRALST